MEHILDPNAAGTLFFVSSDYLQWFEPTALEILEAANGLRDADSLGTWVRSANAARW